MKRQKTRQHTRWRLAGKDYQHKLSPAEAAWLQKFEDEYHRCEFGPDPLHTPEQRRELYAQRNSAERDLATSHRDQVAAARKPTQSNDRHTRYYGPEDYQQDSVSPEKKDQP